MPVPEYRCIERHGRRVYGEHMLINAKGCNANLLDIEYMKQFLRDLADYIDMVRFGDAHVHRFGFGIEIGLSGFQLIETSQVSFHSNDAAGDIYLDVFSCKEFDEDKVVKFLKTRLAPVEVETQVIWRS
ncbi:S-adenosylmethionine decarboxylase (plasmid) [Rhizobium bangladeshense]|uniref:S-adenosylmethionine decarboxylase n=1 Tax=Rhizobium bangladeshense TaxID=1138189 RepID=UPI001A998A6D|nr:S-adenosylmethionine decarboxylase [Rhizobium bangladeshense]QSY98698.1 S-adenosylmethionine decarboxylase [Rhizobium bangladeshense]